MTSPALTPAPKGYPTTGPTVISEPEHPFMPEATSWVPTDLRTTLDAALPRLSDGEAVRIRGLWPAEMRELQAVYEARVSQVSPQAVAVISHLHDAIRRGEWVEQREIARRAHAGAGTVHRVLAVLRGAGVVTSEGGAYRREERRNACQRHRLTSSPALVAITTDDRLQRMRAYAWLTTEGTTAPDDARALLRQPNALAVVRAQMRRRQTVGDAIVEDAVEHTTSVERAATPYSEPAAEKVPVPSAGANTWGLSAEDESFALISATSPHPDGDPGDCVELSGALVPCLDVTPVRVTQTSTSRPWGRGAWVDPEPLVLAIGAEAAAVGERQPLRTAAALYRDAVDAVHEGRGRDPLRLLGETYARCAAIGRSDAEERAQSARSSTIADLPAWVFAMARRELRGEPEPPWPRCRRGASPEAERGGSAPVVVAAVARPAEPAWELGRSAEALAEVGAGYEALPEEVRAVAEQRVSAAYPALAAGFRQSVMWRRLVLDEASAERGKREGADDGEERGGDARR